MFVVSLAGHEAGRAAALQAFPDVLAAESEKIFALLRAEDIEAGALSSRFGVAPETQVRFWHAISVLSRYGHVETSVKDGDEVLVTVSGAAPMLLPAPRECRHSLSRLALMRAEAGSLILETPLAAASVALVSDKAVAMCAQLAAGALPSLPRLGMASESYDEILMCLASVGALDGEDGAREQWEPYDAIFHGRTRGWIRGKRGGTYRFASERNPLPAAPSPRFGPAIHLPGETLPEDLVKLEHLMLRRRSIREYGREPMTSAQLGAVLRCAARTLEVRAVDEAAGLSYETASRPYPSGGACHELELYPIINRCDGLDRGAYWYNSIDDTLHLVDAERAAVDPLLDRAAGSLGIYPRRPDVLVTIAARFGRVNWKYEGLAYALVLKDVGVLLQTMYLVTTALGLAGCAVGTGDSRHFASLTRISPWEEDAVGEFTLGSLP